MNWSRIILIGVTLLAVAYFTILFNNWIADRRDLFFYLSDWKSWVAIAALAYAVTGIFKWLLSAEVKATRPRGARRR